VSAFYLKRFEATAGYTLGAFFIDGRFVAYSLEDACRTGRKIWGETAIPAGRYRVYLGPSQRFGRVMPQIANVPHFEGILIHGGNRVADTAGCPLLGLERTAEGVRMCQPAIDAVMATLKAAEQANESVWLTIEDAVGWPSGPLTTGREQNI
jgi:hypothetical protein